MDNKFQQDNLIGQSNALLEVLEHVSQIAPLSKPVLIIGERGTGKELIAERLHYLSKRWDQSFIKLNCSSLSENLLESELFGHESGAFTGAKGKHEGRFERADGGTLFLDELANTSGLIQEKLLRVIEYGEFERVGGSKTVQADVRLICAANEDLPSLADAGEFRADLLDRLAFDVITLPPLRCRPEDIMTLAEYFAVGMARQLKLQLFSGFSAHAVEQLMTHDWPGNIRELKTWSSAAFTVMEVKIGPSTISLLIPLLHPIDLKLGSRPANAKSPQSRLQPLPVRRNLRRYLRLKYPPILSLQ